MRCFLSITALLAVFCIPICLAANGCVDLDKYNFDKIVKRFKYTLVKFDVAYPYGDKHEAFINFAMELSDSTDDLLFALVGIKDYGDKENADLSQRFNIPEKYPSIKLFNNMTHDKFIDFPESDTVSVENLRKFVSSNSDLYIGLPGCLKELDRLALQFMKSASKEALTDTLEKVKQVEHLYSTERNMKSYKIYFTLMSKIVQSEKAAVGFIQDEKERVQKLLKGKLSENKRTDLITKLHIMESFKAPVSTIEQNATKEEL